MSDTKVLYPKLAPLSVTRILFVSIKDKLQGLFKLSKIFLDHALRVDQSVLFLNKKPCFKINLSEFIDSKYNYLSMVPQNKTEEYLLNYLTDHNVNVEYCTELKGFFQSESGIQSTIKYSSKESLIQSQYLIAADGYNSFVGRSLNRPYHQEEYPYQFILMDAPATLSKSFDHKILIGMKKHFTLMVFPMKSGYRFLAEVSQADFNQNLEGNSKVFESMFKATIPSSLLMGDPTWFSRFKIHEKLIKDYKYKEVFFLGDAAHVHSPAGGQGMNTGIQDAINLSWKLSRVIKNKSHGKLLLTYHQERRPVAQKVIQRSKRMSQWVLKSIHIIKLLKPMIKYLLSLKSFQYVINNTIAQINISYRSIFDRFSKPKNQVYSGDRYLFNKSIQMEDQYYLFDDIGDIPKCWESKYHIKIFKNRRLSSKNSRQYCLVRPDRYIAFIGEDIKALKHYLIKWC